MEVIGMYLIKSAIWLTAFALIYFLFLRNEGFFYINRVFLISGLIASLIFPFITVHYLVTVPYSNAFTSIGTPEITGVIPETSSGQRWQTSLLILFITGIAMVFARLLFQTSKILRIIHNNTVEHFDSTKVIMTDIFPFSFSFFSYVFVNSSATGTEMREIVRHEKEHIRQYHWVDLLLVELLCMIQWFNPLVWVYAHIIKQNHEYLADQKALQFTSNPGIYKAVLINQVLGGEAIRLGNSFSYSLNKKRFTMMKNNSTSTLKKLKTLYIIPVIGLLFYGFAKPEYNYISNEQPNTVTTMQTKQGTVKGMVLQQDKSPLPGTSVVVKGTTIGTITDIEGKFKLKNIPEGSEIVFSFVGYKAIVEEADFRKKMVVTLSKSTIMIEDGIKVVAKGPIKDNSDQKEVKNVKITSSKNTLKIGGGHDNPLIIVDDKEITKKDMDAINPGSIKSISILKDESATELYGEKAKNGVIIISLKKEGEEIEEVKAIMPQEKSKDRPVFFVVEEMPQFPGGEDALRDYLSTHVKYPEIAHKNGIQGIVYTTFIVSATGKVEETKIARGVDPSLDKEALRVVNSMPIWKPGKQRGKNVAVSFTVPINFALQKENKQPNEKQSVPSSDESGEPVFNIVEEMPQFPGGTQALFKYIASKIKYPEAAQKKGIQGIVHVGFEITATGKIENVKIAKGIDASLDKEALRVVKTMPDWKPGKQRGKEVAVAYTLPITFALQ